MAANIWIGDTNDPTDLTHWSLGNVPAGTDTAYFNGDTLTNCTFTANITCAALYEHDGYTGVLNFGASLTHSFTNVAGVQIRKSANLGSSTITTAGDFKVGVATSITVGTSTVVMTGTGDLQGKYDSNADLASLIIGADAAVTVTNGIYVATSITLNGGLVGFNENTVIVAQANCAVVINAGRIGPTIELEVGSLGWNGSLTFYASATGKGLVTYNPAAQVNCPVNLIRFTAGAVVAPGLYKGAFTVINGGAIGSTWTTSAGPYTFWAGWAITNNNAGSTTSIVNAANPTFTLTRGSLTITKDRIAGVVWTKGTGTITFSEPSSNGAYAQTITSAGMNLEAIVVNSANTVTLADALTCTHLTLTAGTLNTATYAVTTGNFSKAGGTTLTPAGLVNATWTITGTFFAAGGIGPATGALTLNVTGNAAVHGGVIKNIDASGGSRVHAVDAIDGGGNTNFDWSPSDNGACLLV